MKIISLFILLLLISPLSTASIINPGFEDSLTGWTTTTDGDFYAFSTDAAIPGSAFPTEGSRYGRIHSMNLSDGTSTLLGSRVFQSGEYSQLTQVVDLTGIDSISFDAGLSQTHFDGVSWSYGSWSSWLDASFTIDGANEWSSNVAGNYLDIEIDTIALSGLHTIGFQLSVNDNTTLTTHTSNWFQFDNLRVNVPAPLPLFLMMIGLLLMPLSTLKRS